MEILSGYRKSVPFDSSIIGGLRQLTQNVHQAFSHKKAWTTLFFLNSQHLLEGTP